MYYAIPGRARGWRRFYRQFVFPGELCFDVGAHVGNRTAALLTIGANVLALEPQPLFAGVLQRLYGKNPHFDLLLSAVGGQPGRVEMLLSSRTPTVATLSEEWVVEVRKTPGFSKIHWDERLEVEATTLDNLIAKHGLPAFCKLDIEGYELEALRDLSQPIRVISFEYLPAVIETALACLDRLMELGDYRFNIVEDEVPHFALPAWANQDEVADLIRRKRRDERAGEVYAQLGRVSRR